MKVVSIGRLRLARVSVRIVEASISRNVYRALQSFVRLTSRPIVIRGIESSVLDGPLWCEDTKTTLYVCEQQQGTALKQREDFLRFIQAQRENRQVSHRRQGHQEVYWNAEAP